MTDYATFEHKGNLTRETLIQYLLSICNELSKSPDKQKKINLESDLRKLAKLVNFLI